MAALLVSEWMRETETANASTEERGLIDDYVYRDSVDSNGPRSRNLARRDADQLSKLGQAGLD